MMPISSINRMAHLHRKFMDVHASQGSSIANEVIQEVVKFYKIK
ncbi:MULTISPECIES: hypothetical protein [unclassified Pseudovibrio]|nr:MULTISPECIES: hypothetical protein [unclassified Pseudovibrio]KZL01856.1 hypothetical protein PsW74_01759 [Pseudovibrio sp. W74]KZL02982.1 hypothetical protein PsAD14_05767 [Pseudovibrio sp. Ad14]